jgi:formate dehydrogenase major subunit
MDVSRRDVLKGAGQLAALAAAGVDLALTVAEAQELRIEHAKAVPSVCPYCSVGCATLVHTVGNKIVNIEGDPRSPHSEGTLCPKGAAIFQLHVNPNRPTKVLLTAFSPWRATVTRRTGASGLSRRADRAAVLGDIGAREAIPKAEG